MNSNWCRNEQVTSNGGASGGMGFCGALAILFIALKLLKVTAVANWSWWWVLSPIWIPIAIILVVFIICVIIMIAKEIR